ncbi:unnamed protein product, partial [Musa textilis]
IHRSCNRRVSSTTAVCRHRDEGGLAGDDDDAGDALEKLKATLCSSTEFTFADDDLGWILNIVACPFAAAVEACRRNIKLNQWFC